MSATDPEILRRISALEAKVEHLMKNLVEGPAASVPPMPAPSQAASETVMQFVRAGDQLGAIKQYREETGCDLVTAKDFVEAL